MKWKRLCQHLHNTSNLHRLSNFGCYCLNHFGAYFPPFMSFIILLSTPIKCPVSENTVYLAADGGGSNSHNFPMTLIHVSKLSTIRTFVLWISLELSSWQWWATEFWTFHIHRVFPIRNKRKPIPHGSFE